MDGDGFMKYKVGDTIVLLDGSRNDRHNTGWCYSMYSMIGKSFVIRYARKNPRFSGAYEYRLEGDEWDYWYDEEWLSVVENFSENNDALDEFFKEII